MDTDISLLYFILVLDFLLIITYMLLPDYHIIFVLLLHVRLLWVFAVDSVYLWTPYIEKLKVSHYRCRLKYNIFNFKFTNFPPCRFLCFSMFMCPFDCYMYIYTFYI